MFCKSRILIFIFAENNYLVRQYMASGPITSWEIDGEAVIKTIPKRKKCKNKNWLFEEALQIAE